MGDRNGPLHAEKDCCANPLVVELGANARNRTAHQQCGDGAEREAAKLCAEHIGDGGCHPFDQLDRNIAEHRIANDHVGLIGGEVATLDIPGEVERLLIEKFGGALDAHIALPLLLADGEECDAWIGHTENAFREDLAHMRVLIQILWS